MLECQDRGVGEVNFFLCLKTRRELRIDADHSFVLTSIRVLARGREALVSALGLPGSALRPKLGLELAIQEMRCAYIIHWTTSMILRLQMIFTGVGNVSP